MQISAFFPSSQTDKSLLFNSRAHFPLHHIVLPVGQAETEFFHQTHREIMIQMATDPQVPPTLLLRAYVE